MDRVLPDVAKLVERLHQVGLHRGAAETSDMDHGGRGEAVTGVHDVLGGQKKNQLVTSGPQK